MVKRQLDEMEEGGPGPGKKGTVCDVCVEDTELAAFVKEAAYETSCDYCKRTEKKPFACDLSDVASRMWKSIKEEWTDPANELGWNGREGGYQGEYIDGNDLIEIIGFHPKVDGLQYDIAMHFMEHYWCVQNHLEASPSERLTWAWERFCNTVMHRRRYTFWTDIDLYQESYHPDDLPAGGMLPELNETIGKFGLLKVVEEGMGYWRASAHPKTKPKKIPDEFTSPPLKYAINANRMSPPGVSMFYGAEHFETAIDEIYDDEKRKKKQYATAIKFATCRPLLILDLIDLPVGLSYFAPNGPKMLHIAAFLRHFADEVSKPIKHDGKQHIEYVPTQVFTENVRFIMKDKSGRPADGIRYRSSRNGRPCVVLFVESDECLPAKRFGREQVLSHVEGERKTIPLATWPAT